MQATRKDPQDIK